MSQILKPASGTQDFLGADLEVRQNAIDMIENSFRSFGFAPMHTPAFERLSTLSGKYGEEGESLIFKILRRGDGAKTGEADLALRYDLTIPGLRAFANNRSTLPPIFKRYQIGPVWRADRPGLGRFREFTQCDVDIYGSPDDGADIEVLSVLTGALMTLGLSSFNVRINSRGVIAALMRTYNVPIELRPSVARALDKADKIGNAGVGDEIEKIAQAENGPSQILQLSADLRSQQFDALLADRLLQGDHDSRSAVVQARDYVRRCNEGLRSSAFHFDPLLVRGLDYYTGFIFEIYADGVKGAISAGGRYDNLANDICGFSVPIVGGSLGLERILLALGNTFKPNRPAPLFVTVFSEEMRTASLTLAQRLRNLGFATYVDVSGKRIDKQLSFANRYNYQHCIILGPDELQAERFIVKDLKSGQQSTFLISEADTLSFAANERLQLAMSQETCSS